MQPKVWGSWPGELVKQFGRFRIHTTIVALPQGVQTNNRLYSLLVENGDSEPISIQSIEARHSDLSGVIDHVRQWLVSQRRSIERIQSIMMKTEEGEQREFEMDMVRKSEERYQTVEKALKELEETL